MIYLSYIKAISLAFLPDVRRPSYACATAVIRV